MLTRIDTVASRAKLKPRREAYWQRVRKGCFVGYRKMTVSGHGTWLARVRDEEVGRKQVFKPLGEFGDLAEHLRFDEAAKAALAWFDHIGRGGAARAATVAGACSRYVHHLQAMKSERAAKDAEDRFKRYVLNQTRLASTELHKLTPTQVETWRKALRELPTRRGPSPGKHRTDSTLNRDMTCFRAALNLAYLEGLLTTDYAWRIKLRPVKNADRQRELYLDRSQRLRFIEKAPADLGAFLRGLCQLPLRPGALAKLTTGDFDRQLKVLKIGHDKSGRDRRIKLPDVTAGFFETAAKTKMPNAPLLAPSYLRIVCPKLGHSASLMFRRIFVLNTRAFAHGSGLPFASSIKPFSSATTSVVSFVCASYIVSTIPATFSCGLILRLTR